MDGLNSLTLNGKCVKLTLKDGKRIIGFLPIQSVNDSYEHSFIAFLPYEKQNDFYAFFKDKKSLDENELKLFIQYIKRNDIETYEIMENELRNIGIENGKPIPNWLELQIKNISKPGHLNVKYKIPDNSKLFDLGDIQIKNSSLTLPLTLVFLSYAKEDKQTVKTIMNDLHNNGILTWFDERELLPGDDWEAKIEIAIEKSDYVLVFISSRTIDKIGYKNREIEYALRQYSLRPSGKRYIIPILLDDCEPPREFKKIQWLKVSEEKWFDKLLNAVGKFTVRK
jgi:hypothetical protein